MTAKTLREILIEKRDIKLDELLEVLEYLEVFNELFETLKEDVFKKTTLKEIYGERLHKLLGAINNSTEKGGVSDA